MIFENRWHFHPKMSILCQNWQCFGPKLVIFRTKNLDLVWLWFSTTSLDLANHSNCQVLIVKLKIVNWWVINTYETRNYSDEKSLIINWAKSPLVLGLSGFRWIPVHKFIPNWRQLKKTAKSITLRLAASLTKGVI